MLAELVEAHDLGGAALGGALVGLGLWLHRTPAGRTGAFALAATGIAVLYLDVIAATSIYEYLPEGGGLVAGMGVAIKALRPDVRVIGVEPAGAASMIEATWRGGPTTLEEIDAFVDGAAVRRAGDWTYAVVARHAPELLAVPEGRVCTEMIALYQTEGIIAEPAGALAASALDRIGVDPGQTVVAVVSGGNNDVLRYPEVVERSLIHEGLKHYFLVDFPQEPGMLRRFLDEVLGPVETGILVDLFPASMEVSGQLLQPVQTAQRRTIGNRLACQFDAAGEILRQAGNMNGSAGIEQYNICLGTG